MTDRRTDGRNSVTISKYIKENKPREWDTNTKVSKTIEWDTNTKEDSKTPGWVKNTKER